MKSPHWWSNQAWPSTASVLPPTVDRAGRDHRGPRVVVRAAGRPEVDPAVGVVERGRLAGGQARGRARSPSPSSSRRRSRPPLRARRCRRRPAIAHGAARAAQRGIGKPERDASADASTLGPIHRPLRVAERARPSRRVRARCDAHDTGSPPRSARKITNSKPYRPPVVGRGGGRCSTTTRSGGRAARRRRAATTGTGSGGRGAAAGAGGVVGWAAGGLARIGPGRSAARSGAATTSSRRRRSTGTRRAQRRQPPVPVAEQAHRRRHEQRPDDRRVEGDRERHPDPERLDQDDVGEARTSPRRRRRSAPLTSRSGRSARGRGRPPPGCRRSGPRPPSSATAGRPRSPSTARTGRRRGSPAGSSRRTRAAGTRGPPTGCRPGRSRRAPRTSATIESVFMTSALAGRTTERSRRNRTR